MSHTHTQKNGGWLLQSSSFQTEIIYILYGNGKQTKNNIETVKWQITRSLINLIASKMHSIEIQHVLTLPVAVAVTSV